MKLTKIIPLTCKNDIRPEISNVYVTPEVIVATNTFSLIEYKNEITIPGNQKIVPGVYNKNLFIKKILGISGDKITYKNGTSSVFAPIPCSEFPNYKQIMPDTDTTPFATSTR